MDTKMENQESKNKQLPTQGEWKATFKHSTGIIDAGAYDICHTLQYNQDKEVISFEEANANAQAICTAINNTYQKGIDPNHVEEYISVMTEVTDYIDWSDLPPRMRERIREVKKNITL